MGNPKISPLIGTFFKEQPYLPEEVLWRQKEQFSDGVGYSWIDSLKQGSKFKASSSSSGNIINENVRNFRFQSSNPILKDEANKKVTDLQMKHAESRFPVSCLDVEFISVRNNSLGSRCTYVKYPIILDAKYRDRFPVRVGTSTITQEIP